MPTSNEYHEGVEACYRLAREEDRDGSLGVTTSTHSYHGYELVLHHENDDRYRVTIFDPNGNRVASTGTHLERQGALTEASKHVDHLLSKRRA
jgi:hypothetical protein